MISRASLAIFGVLLLHSELAAQQPRSAESIVVRVVEVSVSVFDAKGNPIRDLKSSDFEVYDEGKKQDIVNFDVIDHGSGSTVWRPPAARRNFLLLFDVSNSTPRSLLRAREAALQFVNRQVQRTDRVSVGTISAQRGFNLLTAFTTDRDLASRAIQTLGAPKFYAPKDPLLLSNAGIGMPTEAGLEGEVRAHIEEMLALGAKASIDAQRQFIERQLTEMTALGRALDRIAGRKHIVLLSEGFDPRALQGRSQLGSPEMRQEQTSLERGEIWRVDTDNTYGDTRSGSELRRMIESLRRSDVVLHAIDIKGLRTDVDPREGMKPESNDALFLMSHDTGGQLFKNSNALTEELARFLKSQEVIYSLGFRSPPGTPGKFHKLTVKVPAIPGARVLFRTGYYEPTSASSALDRTLTAADIIMNRIPIQELRVTAFAAAVPQTGVPDFVPVVMEIDGKQLAESAGTSKTAAAEIFIYAFDQDDLIRDQIHQRVAFDLSKVGTNLTSRGVKFYGTLRLPPGDYSVRALVRATGQKNGFVEIPVFVPDPQRAFTSSPMLFGEREGWLMVRAPERIGDIYPFEIGDRTFIPATDPILKSGSPTEMVLVVYNMPIEGLGVRASIESPAGRQSAKLSLLGRTPPDQSGAIRLVLNVTPNNVTAGPAKLHVTVDGPGLDTQQVSLPIRIE